MLHNVGPLIYEYNLDCYIFKNYYSLNMQIYYNCFIFSTYFSRLSSSDSRSKGIKQLSKNDDFSGVKSQIAACNSLAVLLPIVVPEAGGDRVKPVRRDAVSDEKRLQ